MRIPRQQTSPAQRCQQSRHKIVELPVSLFRKARYVEDQVVSWSMIMGTEIAKARTTSPTSGRKEASIANPRGTILVNARTGKDMMRASVPPPRAMIGTFGAAHISPSIASRLPRSNTVRVRRDIQIGAGPTRCSLALDRAAFVRIFAACSSHQTWNCGKIYLRIIDDRKSAGEH